jgi:hypothetical protein
MPSNIQEVSLPAAIDVSHVCWCSRDVTGIRGALVSCGFEVSRIFKFPPSKVQQQLTIQINSGEE